MLQKAPRQEPKAPECTTEGEIRQNIETVIHAAEHLPEIYKRASPYVFKEFYKEKGIDLDEEYKKRAVTSGREQILDGFVHNKHPGPAAELAETLPLYANAPHRLGDYLEANVIKTARPDDQGNSFIDFVVEIKNNWLATQMAPKEARDLPAKMTFLIDITTAWGETLEKKQNALRDTYLVRGKEASVLCYKNSLGDLGIKRPKIIISKTPEYMERVGDKLGSTITQKASDSFTINNPAKFDEEYRAYFLDLMQTMRVNARESISYLEGLVPDQDRKVLLDKYRKIIAFVDMYEKTPIKKK
ncbi:MAG: hypothetical protein ACAH17_00340 [Candidatus Paceibacterota bacterium]